MFHHLNGAIVISCGMAFAQYFDL